MSDFNFILHQDILVFALKQMKIYNNNKYNTVQITESTFLKKIMIIKNVITLELAKTVEFFRVDVSSSKNFSAPISVFKNINNKCERGCLKRSYNSFLNIFNLTFKLVRIAIGPSIRS